jgi:SPP1 family predicted phage head-tail adaptor
VITLFDEVIKLVSVTKTVNEYGDIVKIPTEREVFAKVLSIGMKEFYQAQATGLKPEIKFVIADYLDYADEAILKYQSFGESEEHTYKVIRTYRTGDMLEITCQRGIE